MHSHGKSINILSKPGKNNIGGDFFYIEFDVWKALSDQKRIEADVKRVGLGQIDTDLDCFLP